MPDSINNITSSTPSAHQLSSGSPKEQPIIIPDSIVATNLTTDTLSLIVEVPNHTIIGKNGTPRKETIADSSLIVSFLIALFVLVCIRYRKNFRYIKSLITELTNVRQRNNLFDDTIRESSFLFLLNLTYIASLSVLFHGKLLSYFPEFTNIPILISFSVCLGITILFVIWQLSMYYLTGNIFFDHNSTSLWIKGAKASQAIGGVILYPFALIFIFHPEWNDFLLISGIIIFFFIKIIFIFKGFRIFFAQSSSLMIFLYYLCSVEIIPIIFSIIGTIKICKLFI